MSHIDIPFEYYNVTNLKIVWINSLSDISAYIRT